MGLYYKKNNKKKTNTLNYCLLIAPIVLTFVLVLPFLNPVSKYIYGVFGLSIFLGLILMFLVGLARLNGRKFYMSTKNIVYLSLSALFVFCLFHTMFFKGVSQTLSNTNMSSYGVALKNVITAETGITVGGFLITLLVYPFIAVLGVVGASFTFGVFMVVFVGLTVDYYINLKSIYDKQRARREIYKNNSPLPASDTIEGNLSLLNNASNVVPKKLDSSEYDAYYDHNEQEEETQINTDSVIDTEEEALNVQEEELSEVDEFNKRFFSNIKLNQDYSDNLSNDDLATSKYDPDKFTSPEEYIKYPYVPKMFNGLDEKVKNEEQPSSIYNFNEPSDNEDEPMNFGVYENKEDEKLDFNNYRNSSSPFIFNPLENNFSQERSRRFENQETEDSRVDNSNSPFVGYTPSDFGSTERIRNSRMERPERNSALSAEFNSNNPLNFSPKPTPEQIEIPGARNKPKSYKQEQDGKYNPPPTSLLTARPDDPSSYGSDFEEKSRALENILSSFKIDAKVTGVTRGPSVTQYELAMPFGISVKRVLQYDGDIAATLKSRKGIRIEAPIAGKNAVGVEVPNDSPSTVGLRELLESPEFKNSKAVLPFVVGKNISGETIIKSLPKMVHMLVAGSTGSGKSVFLHSILLSLMYKCSPSQLRFILIDPKRVEFTIYSGMPHMMLPNAVSNCEKAINALGWAVKEMERRFDTFQTLSVQNIEDYNHCEAVKKGEYQKIPYIVIVIDELNELMMTGKKEVEEKITRLSQLGRASGIHMIIATQRPSADVVTGTIKNNLPTRVAFALQSGIDSRVILDEVGAEKLLGRGDMLLAPYDDNVTSRVQGAFMSMDEVRKVVAYIKDNNESYFDEEVAKEILADKQQPQNEGGGSSIAGNLEPDEDELLPAALKLCIDSGGASINMVQRRFRVGYARAARIIDQMELAGYISPGNGSKLRTVYMSLDEYHEKFGEDY